MQNAGSRNPSAEERIETVPSYLSTLTAADRHGSPQPADATVKDAQLSRITWDSMVLVLNPAPLCKPDTDLGRAMMLGIFPLRPPRGVASFSERLARVQLLRGLRILGIHVHDEVRIWSKERHLAFRIATIATMRIGLNEFSDRERSAISPGEIVRCWLMRVPP